MGAYKTELGLAMEKLVEHDDVVLMGQGLLKGDRIYGTLNNVSTSKCLEMPIAENLIMGAALGLAIAGYKPVVIFQRMDFMLIAADQIINHLSLFPKMSNGRVKLPVIIRTCIGSQTSKFWVGMQHNKDLTYIFEPHIKVVKLTQEDMIETAYKEAYESNEAVMIVEYKDLF